MTALEVVHSIKQKMEEMNTHCVIALINNSTNEETRLYVFTSNCLGDEISSYYQDTGIDALGLSTRHADINPDEYDIIEITDIADTKILT